MRAVSVARIWAAVLMAVATPCALYAQASPLDEMLKTATRALEVFNYRKADSLAQSVLAFGSVLTKSQRTLALQISIAAIYPEDKPNERQTDTTRARIKQLLAIDPAVWD